ncbi:MAG: hypothetical protein J6E31_08110 [Pyramidobacter sp.]|nr:hypothetical protein [Pyramidobacter sp.]
MNFKPNVFLKEALESSNNKRRSQIVQALGTYINNDLGFYTNDFELALDYVLNFIPAKDLFEPLDLAMQIDDDPLHWDGDYYDLALIFLRDNFCPERIEHVKKVGMSLRHLFPKPKTATTSIGAKGENNGSKGKRVFLFLLLAVGLMISAAVLALKIHKTEKVPKTSSIGAFSQSDLNKGLSIDCLSNDTSVDIKEHDVINKISER